MLDRAATEALTGDGPLTTRSIPDQDVVEEVLERPTTIGRFRILSELGRGGMGVVYEAHDDRLDRRVAVKVVELHRVGPRGRARVRREARALARLSHPNVVQVFEVGEEGASLYLAMEHVEGVTLRQWRRAEPRGWREVLAAYRQAAEGLAAAHDKGLVHRDFKPDNAIMGADGRVRVLDFGLARDRDGEAFDDDGIPSRTRSPDAVTEGGAVVGTPAYMAPEQFLGARLDAGTDQFALCVALFEALYGTRPFEGATRLALLDAVTRGQMVEPPDDRPEPPWVLAALRRGLQTDPSARFPDVRALLAALEPPRGRGRWVGLGLVAAALAGWGVWTAGAAESCTDAAAQWQAGWSPARREAVARALAQAPVPYAAHTRTRVLEALDAYGADWIEEHTAACTATRGLGEASAELMARRMACLHSGRRRFEALVDVLAEADARVVEHAVEAATDLPVVARCADERHVGRGAEPPVDRETAARMETLRNELDVAIAWQAAGRYAAAHERARTVVEQAEALGHRPLLAQARLALGQAQDTMGEPELAVQTLRAAFFDARAADLDDVAARAATLLVFLEGYRLDRYEAADAWAEHARTALERLGRDPVEPDLSMAVANVELARGRYEAGRAGHQRALEGYVALLGPSHPHVAKALGNLANAEFYLTNFEAAVALNERVIELEREVLGPSHPQVSMAIANLGAVYTMMDRHDDALVQLRAALELDLAGLGPSHPRVLETRHNIASVYWKQGDFTRALEEQRQIIAMSEELFGDDSLEVAGALGNMAGSLMWLEREAEARGALRRALAIGEQRLPGDHLTVAATLHNLALVEHGLGDDAALAHARRALEIREQRLPPLHFERSSSLLLLASILESRGELSQAREAAERALEIRERGTTASAGDLANARMVAASLAWQTGGDEALARAMIQSARDGFLAAGEGWKAEHERAVAWLEQHP